MASTTPVASSMRQGNLRDWWTPEDAAKYKTAAQRVVDQFNGFTVVDDQTHVNGRLTLGENIADLGGLTVAYFALQKATGRQAAHEDRRLHAGTAVLSWLGADLARAAATGSTVAELVKTNPHSPGKWRVDGPLANMPEFRAGVGL